MSVQGVLGALTAMWLLAQLGAGWARTDAGYPVTGYGMFSTTSGERIDLLVEARLVDGDPVRVEAAQLGLTDLQLRGFLSERVARLDGTPWPGAEARLASLAAAHAARSGEAIAEVAVWREVRQRTAPTTVAERTRLVVWQQP